MSVSEESDSVMDFRNISFSDSQLVSDEFLYKNRKNSRATDSLKMYFIVRIKLMSVKNLPTVWIKVRIILLFPS